MQEVDCHLLESEHGLITLLIDKYSSSFVELSAHRTVEDAVEYCNERGLVPEEIDVVEASLEDEALFWKLFVN